MCHRFCYYRRNSVLGSKDRYNETPMHTRRIEFFITIFCLRSWGSWMAKNWQWLVRFYYLSWPTKGLMGCYCQHSFVVPITSDLIDRLKYHAWRVAEVSILEGGRVHDYAWWVDDLSVVSHYRYTATPPPPTTIVICSWNQRGIWQRGRDPTHPANKLRRLALVKSNYEVRFLGTRAPASPHRHDRNLLTEPPVKIKTLNRKPGSSPAMLQPSQILTF